MMLQKLSAPRLLASINNSQQFVYIFNYFMGLATIVSKSLWNFFNEFFIFTNIVMNGA